MTSELVPTSGGLSSSEFSTPLTCLPVQSISPWLEMGASGGSNTQSLSELWLGTVVLGLLPGRTQLQSKEKRVEGSTNGQQFQTHHLASP